MAISPNQEEALAVEIRRIYEDAEIQLLGIIAKKLQGAEDVPDWANQKLALLSTLLRDARKITNGLNRAIPKELEKIIELAYLSGNESAMADLQSALQTIQEDGGEIPESIQMVLFPDEVDAKDINVDATMATFTGVNVEAVGALAGATTQQLVNKHVMIVRATEDIYREIITEVVGSNLVGTETRLEVAQRALNKFADKGVRTFRDRSGRSWDMPRYAEMAVRAGIGQASLQGHTDQMQSYGFDLVQISDHTEECHLCRPWEGQILSTSGNDSRYKTLAEAVRAGLFHPNCGHRANTYIEGITKPLTNTEDPDGYKERETQRKLERDIRKWKKREAVAITPKEQEKARAKREAWETEMASFIDETGRRRKREREQNVKAR